MLNRGDTRNLLTAIRFLVCRYADGGKGSPEKNAVPIAGILRFEKVYPF